MLTTVLLREGSAFERLFLSRVFDGEAEFEEDLIVLHLPSSICRRFAPPRVLQRFRGAGNGGLNRALDALLGRAAKLDRLLDVVVHVSSPNYGPPASSSCGQYRHFIRKFVNRIPPLTSAIQAKLLEFEACQRFQPSRHEYSSIILCFRRESAEIRKRSR
jgi:hypothetical protein